MRGERIALVRLRREGFSFFIALQVFMEPKAVSLTESCSLAFEFLREADYTLAGTSGETPYHLTKFNPKKSCRQERSNPKHIASPTNWSAGALPIVHVAEGGGLCVPHFLLLTFW